MAATHQGGLRVGDTVSVPGNMHGTLKFIGPVAGKKGTFAGVQLAMEYATRGKNSGDVDGKYYFRTTVSGSGIFLPVDKAEKRISSGSTTGSSVKGLGLRMSSMGGTVSPGTPGGGLSNYNQGGRTSATTGSMKATNKFSHSIGPGSLARAPSPAGLKPPLRRESLPRPTSPLRQRPASPLRKANPVSQAASRTPAAGRLQTPKQRPSIGLAKSPFATTGGIGVGSRTPDPRPPSSRSNAAGKFSQSLRQSQVSRTRAVGNDSAAPSISSPLGPEDSFDEDEESMLHLSEHDSTPTPAVGRNVDSMSHAHSNRYEQESRRLKKELEQRDQQLVDQANSIAEMERSLAELQKLLPVMEEQGMTNFAGNVPQAVDDEEHLPRDVQSLRATVREKNERIRALTAEFDNNRADFRSTIDTLEMASTETERVYEQRVDELLEQVRSLQERSEDVEVVAQQFKQLEELVQELEEGLEDARRGEAEARGEVEFLRGEVERGRSELRRERERSATKDQLEGNGGAGQLEELEEIHAALTHKDDEIRGLKAIIQNMQVNAAQSPGRGNRAATNNNGYGHSKSKSTNSAISSSLGDDTGLLLQKQIHDLESLLQQKNSQEEKLQTEIRDLRKSVQLGKWSAPNGITGISGLGDEQPESNRDKHRSAGSTRTITGPTPYQHRRKDTDILEQEQTVDKHVQQDQGMPQPLKEDSSIETSNHDIRGTEQATRDASTLKPATNNHVPQQSPSISGHTDNSSNMTAWCEICEESGHDILSCGSMFGDNANKQRLSTGSQVRNGQDVVREGLRRSHESALNPNRANTMNGNNNGNLSVNGSASTQEIDRPAPLRKSSTQGTPIRGIQSPINVPVSSSSLVQTFTGTPTLPPTTPLPDPPSQSINRSTPASSMFKPTPDPTPASDSSTAFAITPIATMESSHVAKPAPLIQGTGDQAGMLAGRSSGIIDPNKWCALCECDGHDSVDCPIEESF